MTAKVCFKCGRELPLSSFYKHPQMGDGHLNKCKDCTKADVSRDYERNIQNPEWVEKERARGREKYHRLGYASRPTQRKQIKEKSFKCMKDVRRTILSHLSEDKELHHWDYNQRYNLIVLDKRLHHRLHSVIDLNLEEGIYYHNGKKLDTIEKHLAIIKQVCEDRGFKYSDVMLIQKLAV